MIKSQSLKLRKFHKRKHQQRNQDNFSKEQFGMKMKRIGLANQKEDADIINKRIVLANKQFKARKNYVQLVGLISEVESGFNLANSASGKLRRIVNDAIHISNLKKHRSEQEKIK